MMARRTMALLATMAMAMAAPAAARTPPSAAESFAIGTSGTTCDAQGVALGEGRRTVFDRKWVILCSDIARPVGAIVKLHGAQGADPLALVAGEQITCQAPHMETLASLGTVQISDCRSASGLDWRSISRRKGKAHYVATGLAAYDSALRLALASLIADRIVPGEVTAASLGSNDPLALYRAKAAAGDVDTLIGQGYRGNSAGAFAQAAELFATAPAALAVQSSTDAGEREARLHEARINRALQLSNLGSFDQAARLFGEARAMAVRDPIQLRLARNFEALDAINRADLHSAADILARPMPPLVSADDGAGQGAIIDRTTAAGLNSSGGQALAGVLGQETRLSPPERARIVDAQALHLRGTVLRLQGQPGKAREALGQAYADVVRVRDGRVVSIMRLRSQILSEMALTFEAEGKHGDAEGLLRQAQALVENQYPESASLNAARARLAGFLARHGRKADALAIYQQIVGGITGNRGALVGMANLMRPYFDLLGEAGQADPKAVADLFLASQLVERPGAADSLAQLSRQLEGGNDAASALFRQSLVLTREIERNRIQIAQQNALAANGGTPEGLDALMQEQQRLSDAQAQVMSALAAYPQYRAVANRFITLDELRASLKPGEAYFKLTELAGSFYAVFATPQGARGWRVDKPAREVADLVAALRDSISVTINGTRSTYPFDLDAALALDDALLGPVAADLAGVRHLVFEPDGALLQLPINLLTADRAGVAAYRSRVDAGGDEFDFRGIQWLGRQAHVSTALSAASFRDARAAPASKAQRSYLGLGQNTPLGEVSGLPSVRNAVMSNTDPGCDWPVAAWNQPISAGELRDASSLFGAGSAEVLTGNAFTDSAIIARPDLASYRIVHFATHGLVTAPRDGCPARPALLTSFGSGQSDGLLSFKEIFDLQLDADLVILSACDTAGQASTEATQEAGVTTGGGEALDGLVRAFIAAGGRQVIASHWPAPDDYGATQRLFSGFFGARGGSVGEALQHSQRALMDDAETSHPFYWSGFAVIGDGSRALPGR